MSVIPFVQARWYTPGSIDRARDLIVLHSMESPLKPGTALGVGRFFAGLPSSNKASAHVGCDAQTRVRYVRDEDVAYAAPGANARGLHIEMAGYARYAAGDWTQPQMMLMLQQAAQQIREWSDTYKIPLRFLNADAVRDGRTKGVTTHNEVSKAFGKSDHWDPGPGFPINTLLAMASSGRPPVIDPGSEEEVPPYFQVNDPTGPGYWMIKRADGGVFAYQGAPHFGALPGKAQLAAPIVAFEPCVKASVVIGYWLLGADGGVFAFGKADFTDSYAGHPEWQHGSRTFTGISQGPQSGYFLVAYENDTDPPKIDQYDLTVKR